MKDSLRQETHRVRCPCGVWAQLRIARSDTSRRAAVIGFSHPDYGKPGHVNLSDDRLLALIPVSEMQINARVLDAAFPTQ